VTDKVVARSALKRALPRVVAILGSVFGLTLLPGAWVAYGQATPGSVPLPLQVPAALPATGDLSSIPAAIAVLGLASASVGLYLRRKAQRES
jgi:LPXTG-motif cell wall-anchored protein